MLVFINKVSSIQGKYSCSSDVVCGQAVPEHLLPPSKDSMRRGSEQQRGQTPHSALPGPSQQALLHMALEIRAEHKLPSGGMLMALFAKG